MRENVQQLILDWANLDAAVETAASQPAGRKAATQLMGSLLLLLKGSGRYSDAIPWCQRILASQVEGDGIDRARAVLTLGVMQTYAFTMAPDVSNVLPEAVRLATLEDDPWALAYAHAYSAMRLANDGASLHEAAAHAASAARLADRLDDDLLPGLVCLAH